MKVGVFSAILSSLSFEDALTHIAGLQCDTVELGTGAHPGDAPCKPDDLLASEGKLKDSRPPLPAQHHLARREGRGNVGVR